MPSQTTIGRKLRLSFGALMALALGWGYSSWSAVHSLGARLEESINQAARAIEIAGDLQGASFDLRSSTRMLLLGGGEGAEHPPAGRSQHPAAGLPALPTAAPHHTGEPAAEPLPAGAKAGKNAFPLDEEF